MEKENIIDVDHLSIQFNLGNVKVNNLKEYTIRRLKHELTFQEFLALKDVDLHVKKGESWGLIGTNGSGKSTLLKTITGIMKPYKGTVKVRGKIAPMIELGAGFDQELTARENIFLNGAVLGHSKKFMEEHFDEIVEFAELQRFLNSPIKNYSSGMKARLGFAVATMVDPDILICDEVLAVGDEAFRRRCEERMQQMLSGGTTLLYVSHDIDSVKQLCDHVLWLDHGEVLMSGDPDTVCDAYARRLDKVYSFRRKLEEDREQLERGDHVDYLFVGAGLFGSVFAHEAKKAGIFHTSDRKVWNYVNRYAEFNQYINAPVARYRDELYNLPFNMNTFSRMWGVVTPEEARAKIQEQISQLNITEPKNLEEQALSLVGRDVYEKLVKDYTEKQWGRDCKDLPAFIIRRLPMRFTYDNNYFNDRYQGIPIGGYTQIVEKLLAGVPTLLGTSWQEYAKAHPDSYDKLIFTGPIDEYFDYALGKLQYRTVRFETEVLETDNYQGNAVVNYTGHEVPWTRIIEHKWFEFGKDASGRDIPGTVISKEFSTEWKSGMEPYYPVNDEENGALYEKYRQLAEKEERVIFGGRLGTYKYYNMDQVVAQALELCEKELGHRVSVSSRHVNL